jgi:hypothetical protein
MTRQRLPLIGQTQELFPLDAFSLVSLQTHVPGGRKIFKIFSHGAHLPRDDHEDTVPGLPCGQGGIGPESISSKGNWPAPSRARLASISAKHSLIVCTIKGLEGENLENAALVQFSAA